MPKIFMVAGLGFGDEGKGTITEYLTHREKARVVVRYNGGAQAAHNVVLADGRHHTFSQFSSGTFQDASTHLSRFMIIDLMALENEAIHLRDLGISHIFERITMEKKALLITPYQRGANRIRELLRGNDKHGSCGVGVGETMSDSLILDSVPRVEDLRNSTELQEKLAFVRDMKLREFAGVNLETRADVMPQMQEAFRLLTIPVKKVAGLWNEVQKNLFIVGDDYLPHIINSDPEPVIFEGAQGILLDQSWGFHPFTTWTDITYRNAYELLEGTTVDKTHDVHKIGVTRTYLTRHGAGPFPTEIRDPRSVPGSFLDRFNKTHEWQDNFRVGHLDLVLLRYAIDIARPDSLAVTHIDRLSEIDKVCVSYDPKSDGISQFLTDDKLRLRLKDKIEDLEYQQRLGKLLSSVGLRRNYWPVNEDFIDVIQDTTGVQVSILSKGPVLKDKIER